MSSVSKKGSAPGSSVKRSADSAKDDQPEKKKIAISFGQTSTIKFVKKTGFTPVSIKLASTQEKKSAVVKVVPKTKKTAAVFDESSDSEPEEMPTEARMRMKNIGRNTPTSAGPNSFNKGKLGFVDSQKLWELQQEKLLGNIQKSDKTE